MPRRGWRHQNFLVNINNQNPVHLPRDVAFQSPHRSRLLLPSDARLAMYSAFLGSLHTLLMMMLQRPVGSAAATPVVPVSARHAAEYLNWAGPAQHRERRLGAYATEIVARRNSEFDRAQGPTPVNLERGQHVLVNHPPYGGFELGGPYNSAINHVAARAKREHEGIARPITHSGPLALQGVYELSSAESGIFALCRFRRRVNQGFCRIHGLGLAAHQDFPGAQREPCGLAPAVPRLGSRGAVVEDSRVGRPFRVNEIDFAGSPAGFGALRPKDLHT